jgi:hypothetical protein
MATTTKAKKQMTADRRALHAYLSEDAHDGWHDFAAEQGVSVSALLEVIGGTLTSSSDLSQEWTVGKLVMAARRLGADRRRRVGINRKG